MKKALIAIAAAATLSFSFSAPVFAAERSNIILAQGWDGDYREAPRPPRGYEMERRDRDWRPDRDRDWRPGRDRPRRDEVMNPRRVARMLESRGYDVGDIDLRRGRYFVRATRPNGRRVMLVVDARSGRILDEQRAGGARRSGFTIEINP
ncbi:antifreeze protein [Phyllobacterium salinisoli]|uniref:Antifreeze protein n=1 Tax=Phyllobacterium salinisoli TaxID=1899321 RepID=A0A368K3G0_9HYPH|nr:PepSY domain-containing protein [Phyllobacterium salinisoli]RCS23917.1 antifreeze protein [Phyllobacterium salinisoli]